ncbi:hypothetical protein GCM10010967_26960 [Dyadobacter beijingensis]|uniref:Yip1 domain-containing protein n=1 Tax=Dyadobacter beijingensis TaxID=365489 RepID=A0ABQ2HUZ4_9BACT|nr:hypothetical protein [Dyadobacter beijingensis]GGM92400.1 hypothetical protein GCM10010967_26960 [Dyadobacter beijingensis]
MTLQQFFDSVSANPWPAVVYFLILPFTAWVVGMAADGSRDIKFWSVIYAILVYAVCIPGIFAVTLNIYLFLFERQSIWKADIVLQYLPVVSMAVTLMLIKSKIPFSLIPGFGKISGFLTLIAALIGVMWFFDRIHLVAFTYVPFSVILIGFVLTLLAIRFAWSKLF